MATADEHGPEAEESAGTAGGGHDDEGAGAISERLRDGLVELEAYLDGEPDEKLSGHVLPLASTWVLPDGGFDLDRYAEEARTFVLAQPQHDRILPGFSESIAFYMSLRLMMNEGDELEPEAAEAHLDAARAALADRATLLDGEGFPLVARGFRLLLEETRETKPPDDRLWRAFALRIGERENPDRLRTWR